MEEVSLRSEILPVGEDESGTDGDGATDPAISALFFTSGRCFTADPSDPCATS